MFHLKNILALILMSASISQAKTGDLRASETTTKVTLQPWLVGLAAVVGFLLIVFVVLIVNRLFFTKDKDEMREREIEGFAFENKAADLEANEENKQTTL